MGKRTTKIKITTEGLGRTEPILLRFIFVTRDLVKICNFGEFVEIGWPHFKKKFSRHLFQMNVLEKLS